MTAKAAKFRRQMRMHYRTHGRDLPWRHTHDPYRILVSEFMLQQTQVVRVLTYYPRFLKQFPTPASLARAPLRDVLRAWQGLGYNRRALHLKQTATLIIKKYHGKIPRDFHTLQTFPGVGQSTAGALMAFAFNAPMPFIETNIRRVYIHHFFGKKKGVSDAAILTLVEKTLDRKDPRAWYYALMDYGAHLGTMEENPNTRSKHYKKQSPFSGSNREIRSRILRELLDAKTAYQEHLVARLDITHDALSYALDSLIKDRFIRTHRGRITLASLPI